MSDTRILLVDDEERFVLTTRNLLERRGGEVYTAFDGFEALRVLDEKEIDVVLLDIKMPGMDGVAALHRIKKKHPLVEVILLTGHASVESAVEGIKLGAFDYLMKPCDVDDVWAKVNEARAKKREAEERLRKEAEIKKGAF